MSKCISPLRKGVTLLDAELQRRHNENRKYLLELDNDRLLLNFRHEAGLPVRVDPADIHDGWEHPLCQLRGHFLGHWLSAAAFEYYACGDKELKAKADAIVDALAECQQANGGQWCAPIPEKYLSIIAAGKRVWAPQYTIHKVFMGLLDMYEFAGNALALEIAVNFGSWFHNWAIGFDDRDFARILDVETGGMLEEWARLFRATGDPIFRELMDKYYRRNLFDSLLLDRDVLTNMHANTTVPEALGAAIAYEVTGDEKWLAIVKAYWEQAVTQRGTYCTGGQTSGEVWTPKNNMATRLGTKNQEHCVVYNMMRLADFLFRHTGEARFADYWEQNLYNGIMAQGYYQREYVDGDKTSHPYPEFGLLTYFLPLRSGERKKWATKTKHFYCCHGTLVQANASLAAGFYYHDDSTLYVNQFFSSQLSCHFAGSDVRLIQQIDSMKGDHHVIRGKDDVTSDDSFSSYVIGNNPGKLFINLNITCPQSTQFTLRIRVPWWHKKETVLRINGEEQLPLVQDGFIQIDKLWQNDNVQIEYHTEVTTSLLAGSENTVAFLYGPVVLAGLSE
ncbi:MAG: glycoside hydrolase family 127 protein, partial [Symbiobacteriaceae bacterium]|nr:glycoside hydrolase family 127 protein [Symbiobacteriaceae bacterium]